MPGIYLNIKKIFGILLGMMCASSLGAQNFPAGSSRPAATPVNIPAAYSTPIINYVRSWEPSMPTTDTAAVKSASRTTAEVKQTTQYFDGLGRILQTVKKGLSASGKDMVTPVVYDSLGREVYRYLPYVQQSDNSSDGKFKTDPFNSQKTFYKDAVLNPGAAGESIYYNQMEYEASPLNRILKSYSPGNNWASTGGNRPIAQQYLVNTTADSVRIWNMPVAGIKPVSAQIYDPGQLYKDVVIDERGSAIVEFKDKEGRVVLKKAGLGSNVPAGHDSCLCTYYVYDDQGNLRCVIPPKAVGLIKGSWVIADIIIQELCFLYRYDGRNRLIMKKMPGADSTEMVYDIRDRLVFSRDGNLKTSITPQWFVTFYDELNRPSMTALYNSAATRTSLQTAMNATTSSQSLAYTFPGVADLVVAVHDRPIYQATQSVTLENGFDSGLADSLQVLINPNATEGQTAITINNPLPGISINDLIPLSYTYYNDYTFAGAQPYLAMDSTKPKANGNPYAESVGSISTITTGLVTGTKARILGTDKWLTTTSYYNDKGRVAQVTSDNVSGGQDILTNLYDFNGKLLSNYLRHKNPRSGTTPQTTVLTMMTYDNAGRLAQIVKQLNDDSLTRRVVAQIAYDELGQLKRKNIGVKNNVPIETLDYEYNIHGWLKGINKNYVNNVGGATNWFGQELSYDDGFQTNQYNGNISGTKWRSKSADIARAYGYNYDPVNRLLKADFAQNDGGTWNNSKIDFTVTMGNGTNPASAYDANGNILSMTQKGMKGKIPGTIDQLTYTYQQNQISNKLQGVVDAVNDPSTTLGDFREINGTGNNDYVYDTSGNLKSDVNKNIRAIVYNHLNLPQSIAITGKGSIAYRYDAGGNKLEKIVTDSTGTVPKVTTTDYINGFVYENDTLQFLAHEEGRIRAVLKTGQPVAYKYDYFVKDHLGDIRVVLTEQSDVGVYAATMETAPAPAENALFSNLDNTRTPKPVGYPADATTSPNDYVARLNATNGQKIGPSLVLRVMAGDTLQIGSKAFYKSTAANTAATTTTNMLAALLQAFGGGGIRDGAHAATGPGSPLAVTFNNSAYDNLKQKDPSQNLSDKPKSYLNYALFDDQFVMVDENSGVKQVQGTPDVLQTLATDKMVIKKTGFIYIYTSNESAQDVFFDNLVVSHSSGPLLEETHYYPFGLTMAGISSNALKGANYPENKYKFNKGSELQSKEFSDGSGLELYETPLRTLDPQLGRWWQIDSKPDYAQSVYAAMGNNPILRNDPLGDSSTVPWSTKANQSPVNLLKPLGTGNGAPQNSTQNGVNPGNGATANNKNEFVNGNSATVKQTGENDKPLVGSTITNKSVTSVNLVPGFLGDKISLSHSVGIVSGRDGSIISTDVSTDKGKIDGAAITILSTVTIGISADFSVSAGVSVMGYEGHVSAGIGVGFGQIGAGGSRTNESGAVSGNDMTIRPGFGTFLARTFGSLILSF